MTHALPEPKRVTYPDPMTRKPFLDWLDQHKGNCIHCQEPHTLLTHWSGCDGRPPVKLISGLFAQTHEWRK